MAPVMLSNKYVTSTLGLVLPEAILSSFDLTRRTQIENVTL